MINFKNKWWNVGGLSRTFADSKKICESAGHKWTVRRGHSRTICRGHSRTICRGHSRTFADFQRGQFTADISGHSRSVTADIRGLFPRTFADFSVDIRGLSPRTFADFLRGHSRTFHRGHSRTFHRGLSRTFADLSGLLPRIFVDFYHELSPSTICLWQSVAKCPF